MFCTHARPGAPVYLTSDSLAVPHAFTTRLGGVSQGIYASLNLGIHRGDRPGSVAENDRLLAQELEFSLEKLVLTAQVHGNTVLPVTAADGGAGLTLPQQVPCDGLITADPGIALMVFTADCTPILLWDSVTGAVGAVHAGWRGTAAGIAERAVEAMASAYGCVPERLHAAIGPNIGPCCFTTHEDVPQAMYQALGTDAEPFIQEGKGCYHVDLKGLNAQFLRRSGVTAIDISTECTACSPNRYWSARITGSARGSQGAVIVCKGGRS